MAISTAIYNIDVIICISMADDVEIIKKSNVVPIMTINGMKILSSNF